jgi:dynein heavy chain
MEDIQILLDDHIMKTATMKTSPFVKAFENKLLYFISIYLLKLKNVSI